MPRARAQVTTSSTLTPNTKGEVDVSNLYDSRPTSPVKGTLETIGEDRDYAPRLERSREIAEAERLPKVLADRVG